VHRAAVRDQQRFGCLQIARGQESDQAADEAVREVAAPESRLTADLEQPNPRGEAVDAEPARHRATVGVHMASEGLCSVISGD